MELTDTLLNAVRRVESADVLDGPASLLHPLADRLTRSDATKRALSGTPLGHRLHPALTSLPLGLWTAASVVDAFVGRTGRPAAQRLAAAGILAAIPTAATGLSDWGDTHGGDRRIGVVHAAANVAGLSLEIASWSARRKGKHVRGALLGMSALGFVSVAGYLGGHLVFTRRVGVDVDVPVADDRWQLACRFDDLIDGEPIRAVVQGAAIVLVRNPTHVDALAATCSHAGGPLDQGSVDNGVLSCPWHKSRFCLADGSVVRGPAVSAQPVYETRIRSGLVEVRLLASRPEINVHRRNREAFLHGMTASTPIGVTTP